ncbi:pectate lyase [Stieleria marina]|uniref:Pectic acid lyase n=1 Tax=Stieleria marina TaxID=1930275 RepID=A0A517NP80_9BACT|nr:Pectic acid lyase [Planctomycetes bacterium K23_9]
MNCPAQWKIQWKILFAAVLAGVSVTLHADDSPRVKELTVAKKTLASATQFMRDRVSVHGGYSWFSSADGKLSHGEGVAGPERVWVQPPGAPAVAMAMLKAYRATGDPIHLQAARDAGDVLIGGQLRSGGWGYSIELDEEARKKIPYRVGPNGGRDKILPHQWPGGWGVWKTRKYKTNRTLIDDDTTPSVIRFLASLDQSLEFKDAEVHEAVMYALRSVMGSQYPIGAWGHNYDRFPLESPSKTHYPIVKASYPDRWTKKSQNDFTGCYMLNDRQTMNMIETMMLCAKIYNDDRFWYSAKQGGEFLILAQMPDPQPAWAQQYNHIMHPVWDRKFEPPAITGGESQDAMRTLIRLYRETKDKKFLEPIPRALAYLKTCLRDDGKLARYYELKTNRPLYFDKAYQITYDDADMPDHYGFIRESQLDEIERDYLAVLNDPDAPIQFQSNAAIRAAATKAMQTQNDDGAWLEKGFVRNQDGKKVIPPEGVVSSQTYIDNVDAICELIRLLKE